MEEYPSNSKNVLGAKEPKAQKEKKIERVTQAEVVQKQKSMGRRMKDLFVGADFKGVTEYVFGEVLIPALKNMIVDAGSRGLERIFYRGQAPRRYTPVGGSRVTYNSPVQRSYDPRSSPSAMLPGQPPAFNRGGRRDTNEIMFSTRSDADTVLESFSVILDKYEAVSVSDLYDMVGLPASHTDQKWGWTSAVGVSVRQTRDGYVLDLPPAEPL